LLNNFGNHTYLYGSCSALKYADLPSLTIFESTRFYTYESCSSLKYQRMPLVTTLGRRMWRFTTSFKRLYLPSLTSSQSDTFNNMPSGIKIYVPATSPLAGSQFVKILNSNAPSPVLDLTASSITSSGCNLDFTTPSSANALDFYEVWVENIDLPITDPNRRLQQLQFDREVTASGQTISGLLSGTNYKIFIVACDVYWNRSLNSNEITITTL
jgi:hypothetical protein